MLVWFTNQNGVIAMWDRLKEKCEHFFHLPPLHPPLPVKDLTLAEVQHAVHQFAREKPDGIYLSVLIKDQLEIDFTFLVPYLGCLPSHPFYMSRETYEIFEEPDTPRWLDLIQRAVDHYMDDHQDFPVWDHEPAMRICYFKLKPYIPQEGTPPFDTYITEDEFLISREKPSVF